MKDFYIVSLMSFLIGTLLYGIEIQEINQQPNEEELREYIIHLEHQPNVYETNGKVALIKGNKIS